MARVSPLGVRIFGLSALTIVASIGVGLVLVQQIARRAVDRSLARALEATQASIQDKLQARSSALRATATALASVPTYLAGVERALTTTDRSTLLDLAEELKNQLGASWVVITDQVGVLQAWSDHPDRVGLDLARGALVTQALEGTPAEGIWLEPTANGDAIFQAVAVPFRTAAGSTPLGILIAALSVDSVLAVELKKNTSSEVLFFTRDTLGLPVPNVSTLPEIVALDRAVGADTSTGRVTVTHGNNTWVGAVGVLRSASGVPLAGVVGFRSREAELEPFVALRRTLALGLAGGLLLALASSAWLAGRITGPVRALVATTRRVEQGDYDAVTAVTTADEIGELSRAVRHMVDELRQKQRLLDYVATSETTAVRVAPTPTGAAAVPLAVGSVVAGRYELKELLGSGGMGVVYRAYDRELGEMVALKSLHPGVELQDPSMLERFKQEIRLARRITHRNVVRTHDLGEDGGRLFLTMEYVEGTTLDHIIRRRGQLPVDVTLTVVKQLLRALEVAHEAGVIHRDVKPGNLVVDASGFVKVMDFGIARLAERKGRPGLTEVGSVVGSPDYMAPEQLMGEEADARVDIYATGCVMFEALTGRRVFEAPNLIALIAQHLEGPVPEIATLAPTLPPTVATIVMRALAKDRTRRWSTASEMLAAIEAA